jgi:hypothetical protein
MDPEELRWTFMGPSPWSRWSLSAPPRKVAFETRRSADECREELRKNAAPEGVLCDVKGNRLWLLRRPRGYFSFWREFHGELVPSPDGGTRIDGEIGLNPAGREIYFPMVAFAVVPLLIGLSVLFWGSVTSALLVLLISVAVAAVGLFAPILGDRLTRGYERDILEFIESRLDATPVEPEP